MVQSGSALVDATTPRFPTDVLVFDVLMGGGLPMGKFNLFHGAKSSGKTTLAMQIAGAFLKTFTNKSVVWGDMEQEANNQ